MSLSEKPNNNMNATRPKFVQIESVTAASHPCLSRIVAELIARNLSSVTVGGFVSKVADAKYPLMAALGLRENDSAAAIDIHWGTNVKQAMWAAITRIDHPQAIKGGLSADEVESILHPMFLRGEVTVAFSEQLAMI